MSTLDSCRETLRETNVTGERKNEINEAISAIRWCCKVFLPQPEGGSDETMAMRNRLLKGLQDVTKLHCIACMRNGRNVQSVFSSALRWGENPQDDLPPTIEEYLKEVLHELLVCRGVIGTGKGKMHAKAASGMTAYQGSAFLEQFMEDTFLQEILRKKGLELAAEEIQEIFTRGVRVHVAVHNIGDPLYGVRKWARDETMLPWGTFEDMLARVRTKKAKAQKPATT